MADQDHSPLSAEAQEEIETEQHKIHQFYWQLLRTLAVNTLELSLSAEPPPPKTPIKLGRVLGDYACALFDIERKKYPNKLGGKLSSLADKSSQMVLEMVAEFENRSFGSKLGYHATWDRMGEAIREALRQKMKEKQSGSDGTLVRSPKVQEDYSGVSAQGDGTRETLPGSGSGDRTEVRKAFVTPILDEKGWSILDWANEAEVAYHTAADYLAGTTNEGVPNSVAGWNGGLSSYYATFSL